MRIYIYRYTCRFRAHKEVHEEKSTNKYLMSKTKYLQDTNEYNRSFHPTSPNVPRAERSEVNHIDTDWLSFLPVFKLNPRPPNLCI